MENAGPAGGRARPEAGRARLLSGTKATLLEQCQRPALAAGEPSRGKPTGAMRDSDRQPARRAEFARNRERPGLSSHHPSLFPPRLRCGNREVRWESAGRTGYIKGIIHAFFGINCPYFKFT